MLAVDQLRLRILVTEAEGKYHDPHKPINGKMKIAVNWNETEYKFKILHIWAYLIVDSRRKSEG